MLFTVYVSSDTKLHAISMTYEWDQQQLSFQIEITQCYLQYMLVVIQSSMLLA